jgi:UDP-N-acetylglucosamine--dolichyl-phosphate N-acetylglucosaminephosphotransferase
MDLLILGILSFLVTVILTPLHIRIFSSIGKTGQDRHKLSRPSIPEMGGLAIIIGIVLLYSYAILIGGKGILTYAIASLAIVFLIGILDDIYAIRQRTKLLLLTLSAIPILTYDGGVLDLTILEIEYGLFFYVLVIIGMAASSNLTNILEGFNGESIGLGVISTGFLILDAHILGNDTIQLILIPIFSSLLAFILYNRYPSKVFPGDTGTLPIGGAIAVSVILGGNVILGIIVLMPQILEFLLKSRVRFKGVGFGPTQVDSEGYLTPPPYMSVANLLTSKIRLKEYSLVIIIWSIGALFGFVSLIITLYAL